MEFAYVLYCQPMIAKMTDDELKQIYKTYKKNLQDEKTEDWRTKLVKRKEYIKACDKKILEGVSVEPVQAIREAQKLVLKKFYSTVQGRNRKIRIINKLILNRKK